MTSDEFNDKYDEYLEAGHYGLAIDIPSVVEFLDKLFEDLTKIEGFKYSQIKMKFSFSRFYASGINGTTSSMIENQINNLVQRHYGKKD